ncbi:MAG TPA: hypothetical protein VJT15_00525 [Pyrinomonadaceae bacterium]|nr:hypothetical protein [Pyrinomonadaceae bacterium]
MRRKIITAELLTLAKYAAGLELDDELELDELEDELEFDDEQELEELDDELELDDDLPSKGSCAR